MKILIIGGVAGGASAAARLRRLNEEAEIVMFERGNYISFANCGLPYYIGGKIRERENLLVQTPAGMGSRFNIDVRINTEVVKIDRQAKAVEVKNTKTGDTYVEAYDYIVLSPGAEPVRPPIPGIEGPNIFSLRSLDDTDRISRYLSQAEAKSVIIVGGGFIGLEMAENIHALGAKVTVVEASSQVMAPLDPEMAGIVHRHMTGKGVRLLLNQGVTSFADYNGKKNLTLQSGEVISADAVILAIGVKPESELAKEAGLELGDRGTVRVNEYMQTSDPSIYAVGDVTEAVDFVNGYKTYIPLAGPANRQGRIAADNIAGRKVFYKGTQGTSIAKVFDLAVACTGNNEKTLTRLGISYEKSYTVNASHAGYYPGAIPINIKLIFDSKGKILGAQAVGVKGVDKRIDV
ncbi:MAG TPA: FAD-dependent oxidoreductase, partial [Desulfobacteria bacterium]|nr:FAD-dependent oxidoreductase [Desulfobacteria bacterium]